MFNSAAAFNQPLAFDTSSVTNMGGMFYEAVAFNQPLLNFDATSLKDAACMFEGAAAFNQPRTVRHLESRSPAVLDTERPKGVCPCCAVS